MLMRPETEAVLLSIEKTFLSGLITIISSFYAKFNFEVGSSMGISLQGITRDIGFLLRRVGSIIRPVYSNISIKHTLINLRIV
jgi:hypothetical protein